LLQQPSVDLLLAGCIGCGLGSFDHPGAVLAPAAGHVGGNLFARYGSRLFGQRGEESDLSLSAYRAVVFDCGDPVTLVRVDARQAGFHLGIRTRWDGNGVSSGVAIFPKDRPSEQLLTQPSIRAVKPCSGGPSRAFCEVQRKHT